ncbi:hypothetical protein C8R43DRAFT_960600 [Mycena crocata]|nr:hypothetical protein C8R43DRAFT_960600 [Mycena crocata]
MYMSGAERQSMERRRAPSWPCEGYKDWGDAWADGMEGAKLAMRGMDGLGRRVDGWDGGRQVGHARYEGMQGGRTLDGYLPRSLSNSLSALPTYDLRWLSGNNTREFEKNPSVWGERSNLKSMYMFPLDPTRQAALFRRNCVLCTMVRLHSHDDVRRDPPDQPVLGRTQQRYPSPSVKLAVWTKILAFIDISRRNVPAEANFDGGYTLLLVVWTRGTRTAPYCAGASSSPPSLCATDLKSNCFTRLVHVRWTALGRLRAIMILNMCIASGSAYALASDGNVQAPGFEWTDQSSIVATSRTRPSSKTPLLQQQNRPWPGAHSQRSFKHTILIKPKSQALSLKCSSIHSSIPVCLLETCVTGFESRPDMISALQQLEARLRELKGGFIETTTYSVLFYNQSLVRHCAKCLWNGCNFTHPGSTCVMIPAPRAFNGNRARLCNLKLRSFGPSIDAFIDGPSPVYLSYPMVSDPVLDLNPLQRGFLCSQDSHSKTPNPTCLAQFWTDFLETALCYIVWILLNVPVSNPRCDSQNPADAPMQISQPKDSSLAARLPEVPSHNSISTTIPSNHTSMELGSCGVAVWGGSRDRRERNKPFWWSEGACLPCKSCLFAVGYYPTLSNVDYAALSTVDSFVGKAILDGSIRHTPLADRSGILVDQEKLDIQKDQPALMLTERRTGAVLRENVGKPQIRRWIRTGLGPRFLAAAHLHPGRSRKAEAAIRALAVIVTHRWEIVCCLSDRDVPMEELAHERICEGGPGNGQEKIGAIFDLEDSGCNMITKNPECVTKT